MMIIVKILKNYYFLFCFQVNGRILTKSLFRNIPFKPNVSRVHQNSETMSLQNCNSIEIKVSKSLNVEVTKQAKLKG